MSWNRRVAISEKEMKLREEWERLSNAQLRTILACRSPGSDDAGVLSEMLEERKFWRRFWSSGIVAWLSLIVAIVALVLGVRGCTKESSANALQPTTVSPRS